MKIKLNISFGEGWKITIIKIVVGYFLIAIGALIMLSGYFFTSYFPTVREQLVVIAIGSLISFAGIGVLKLGKKGNGTSN